MPFILDLQEAQNPWVIIRPQESEDFKSIQIPTGMTLVPLATWQAQTDLHSRTDIGIWLENTTEVELINVDWNIFPVIALDFPKFTDGRSQSIAYLLRNRFGFKNQLHAIGEVLVDQLFYMRRVGFNGFHLRADQSIEQGLRCLDQFTETYQGSTDNPTPVFGRQVSVESANHDLSMAKKIADLETCLIDIAKNHQPAVFANSLAMEDMIITDVISRLELPISMFTLQTGMLHPDTLNMVNTIKNKYDIDVQTCEPDPQDIKNYIDQHGQHAFYESLELRKSCCNIRKVKPLQAKLKGQKSWVTGQRSEQSITRLDLKLHEHDFSNGLDKFNPLHHWTFNEVQSYITQYNVPYNPLHDKNYPSIGCDPCTRAIKPGEDLRAGRWWWEQQENKECGLHLHEDAAD